MDHLYQTAMGPVYFRFVLIFRPNLWEPEVRIVVNILSKDFFTMRFETNVVNEAELTRLQKKYFETHTSASASKL